MSRTRLALAALGSVVAVGLGVVAVPFVFGGYDSVTEALVRNLHRQLLVVAVPLALLVQAMLFYAAVKFHGNDDPTPTEDRPRLEISWTIAVALILLFVGASSYLVLAHPMVSTTPEATAQPADVRVDVTAQNWFWTFTYPGENVTTTNQLVLPTDRTVFFTVTSTDVIHAVHVPAIGLKQDAIPGQRNVVRTRLTDTGTYRLYCAEFCGAGHSKMTATVKVVPPTEYRAWLDQHRGTATGNGSSTGSGDA